MNPELRAERTADAVAEALGALVNPRAVMVTCLHPVTGAEHKVSLLVHGSGSQRIQNWLTTAKGNQVSYADAIIVGLQIVADVLKELENR